MKHTKFNEIENLFINKQDYKAPDSRDLLNKPEEDKILYKGTDKEEYDKLKLLHRQQNFINHQWRNAGNQVSQTVALTESNRILMYRDANLMDIYPHIGTALDVFAEEATTINEKGKILNIYSSSERIQSVLEDLFNNRLDIHVNLYLWARNTAKYGDTFLLLNIDKDKGILSSRQLPVDEIERIDNDFMSVYTQVGVDEDPGVRFLWKNANSQTPFRNWQVAHFRHLNDSLYLPYGMSMLAKARRHWRLLTMMEDMLLIYRLERSIERRVYKVFVGNIDDADVDAYVNDIANTCKRTQIIDPATGQIDLRKNVLGVDQDLFIPVRSKDESSPVDVLPSSNNLNTTDDLKFFEDKLVTSLRVPKAFLGFTETAGEGNNLALLDVRFARAVNRLQQTMLMELNKIAMIHLYLLGFTDELSNFTLSLNNPSKQNEMLFLDALGKRVDIFQKIVADTGNGIPAYSWTKACKEILRMSDREIVENLNEIRLEKGIAAELLKTKQIIKRTGVFDSVDRLYGEPDTEYSEDNPEGGPGGPGGGPGGPPIGGGGGMDFGEAGGDLDMDMEGDMGEMPLDDAIDTSTDTPDNSEEPTEATEEPPMENLNRKHKKIIHETFYNSYLKHMNVQEEEKPLFENTNMSLDFDLFTEVSQSLNESVEKMKKQL